MMETKADMDINRHIENTWKILSREPVFMIIGGLLALLMNIASIGLLSGPIFGGYFLGIVWYFREGRRPEVADIFLGFQRFGALLPFIISTLLVIVGFFLLIIPGFLLWVWWMYVLLLMADKKLSLAESMAASRRKVQEKGFFMHCVFLVLITLLPSLFINAASFVVPLFNFLNILVLPIQSACLASLYLEQFPEAPQKSEAFSLKRSAPPPPPPNSEY